MKQIKINKHGITYIKNEPKITFSFYAGGFGTCSLTEDINTVKKVLNKSLNDIDHSDLITHPYAIIQDGYMDRFVNDYDSIEDLEECSPWYKQMTIDERNDWIEEAKEQYDEDEEDDKF